MTEEQVPRLLPLPLFLRASWTFYQSTVDLRAYWDSKGYKYEYVETDGGHIWRNWRIYLTMFAQKIFK